MASCRRSRPSSPRTAAAVARCGAADRGTSRPPTAASRAQRLLNASDSINSIIDGRIGTGVAAAPRSADRGGGRRASIALAAFVFHGLAAAVFEASARLSDPAGHRAGAAPEAISFHAVTPQIDHADDTGAPLPPITLNRLPDNLSDDLLVIKDSWGAGVPVRKNRPTFASVTSAGLRRDIRPWLRCRPGPDRCRAVAANAQERPRHGTCEGPSYGAGHPAQNGVGILPPRGNTLRPHEHRGGSRVATKKGAASCGCHEFPASAGQA